MITCSSKQRIGQHFDTPKQIVEPQFGRISRYSTKQISVSRIAHQFKSQSDNEHPLQSGQCKQKKYHKSTLTLFHKQTGDMKNLIHKLIKQAGGHLLQISAVPEEEFYTQQ